MSTYSSSKPKPRELPADIDARSLLGITDPSIIISDADMARAVEIYYYQKETKQKDKLDAKRREEERKAVERYELQQKERREREQKGPTLAQRQKRMILSGKRDTCNYCHLPENGEWYGHSALCPVKTGRSMEPGLRLIALEYKTGRLIELDQVTRDRLVDFAIPDETFQDVINRLLNFAISEGHKKGSSNDTLQTKKLNT
jgi:hypothetical protein